MAQEQVLYQKDGLHTGLSIEAIVQNGTAWWLRKALVIFGKQGVSAEELRSCPPDAIDLATVKPFRVAGR